MEIRPCIQGDNPATMLCTCNAVEAASPDVIAMCIGSNYLPSSPVGHVVLFSAVKFIKVLEKKKQQKAKCLCSRQKQVDFGM